MSRSPHRDIRVLAIGPTSRGFGFAVLEGPDRIIEWGTREAKGKGKNEALLTQIAALAGQYRPDLLLVEDAAAKGSRRRERIRRLVSEIARTARGLRVRCRRMPRRAVMRVFSESGPTTKPWIAAAVASRFPVLSRHLPAKRMPWMAEDPRMGIFDAVAMAITHYARKTLLL